ncbi:MAG: hypothetical protein WCS03_17565 [Bacteroidota bacterium]
MTYILKDVLPIFTVDIKTSNPLTFEGTVFVIADNLLITCWHCVQQKLSDEVKYAVLVEDEKGKYTGYTFFEVLQDRNGHDLATARINRMKNFNQKFRGSFLWDYLI